MAKINKNYQQIKKILDDNGINSKDLDYYLRVKSLRYLKHKKEVFLNDQEIELAVQKGLDKFQIQSDEDTKSTVFIEPHGDTATYYQILEGEVHSFEGVYRE